MSRAPESILGAEDGAAYRRFLEWSPGAGFDLAIIKVALPVKRDALIAWTREQIPGAREIDLRQVGPERSRLWDLLHAAAHDRGATMLILYGLEESAVRERLLAQLNVERDELVKTFALPWILFVHPTVYPELMQKAPDFIDFAGVWLEDAHLVTPALSKMPVARTEAAAGEMAIGTPEARDLLTEAALAIALWRLDEGRDLLARYGLEHPSTAPEDLDGTLAKCLGALIDNRFEEALRLLQENLLPALERLENERAVTMMYVARILHQRGELDEALWILREYVLPIFDRSGKERPRAIALSLVADVLFARSDYDEALRILREEALPVIEKLGDVRLRAVTLGKMADVLRARGDYDDALRSLREEVLPIYEKLGRLRDRAVMLGKVADVLQARGDYDDALRIRREEQLPIYEKVRDVRERAVTMAEIGSILYSRDEMDEALRILREEVLPVYEKLGDVRSLLVGRTNLATMLATRGRAEDAPEIVRLLALAFADARRLRLPPDVQHIETLIRELGLDPHAPPFV
ncbi:MAG: tetratricopeptide repeat protein [Polyangiaceae bacterium]|nr:tetratricopeptide repeat protein [Polyangiaceae bacterium]